MSAAAHPTALYQVRSAVLANMKPGLVLWSGLVLLLLAYLWSPAVQSGLTQWGTFKQAWGVLQRHAQTLRDHFDERSLTSNVPSRRPVTSTTRSCT